MANSSNKIIVKRHFTEEGKAPEDYFDWGTRNVQIKNRAGSVIYDGKDIRFPNQWTDLATKVVSSKYFFKGDDPGYLEKDLQGLASRVVDTIAQKGVEQGIFSRKSAKNFMEEMIFMVYNQSWAANSPVWFNVGLHDKYDISEKEPSHSHWAYNWNGEFTNDIDAYDRPQGAACFIQSIKDNMESIMEHAKKEAMLFKFGSGTGTDYGPLRGVREPLSGGGFASGQTSFLRIYDIIAASVRSGGKTRRAAKMVIEPDDHPDLLKFIHWKVEEEKKALWLSANHRWGPKDANDLESEAYKSVTGQNGNNSIRVTDKFMNAALRREDWSLWFRTADRFDKEIEIPLEEYVDDRYLPDKRFIKKLTNKRKIVNAGEVFDRIARAAAVTGDPAIQYDSNINKWNTVPNYARINASNPCSEFMAPDDSACNLASVNLTRFSPREIGSDGVSLHHYSPREREKRKAIHKDRILDLPSFKQGVRNSIITQEILVDYISYPSKEIAENSHRLRPLGLGYTNLAALLMENGVPYDSDKGRAIASAVTSLMTAYAYQTSSELASKLGAFEEFENNKEPMLNVLKMHRDHTKKIQRFQNLKGLEEILDEAEKVWEDVLQKGEKYGFRNSQVTLLAPTGTIGFMMDVDTTGIEPVPAFEYEKGLAGGGELEMEMRNCLERGLRTLGYNGTRLENILGYVKENGSVIGAPNLKEEDYNVFATAFGDNVIQVDGHLEMMGAVQPFLSGAISKTINMPKGTTIGDIKNAYIKGWELGLKSVSVYVDGAKGIQPINVKTKTDEKELKWGERVKPENPMLKCGFVERPGWNVKIGETGVHLMVGEYEDRPPKDAPADFFVEFGSSGSEFSANYTDWGKEASRNRQRGEALEEFIEHTIGGSDPIKGWTNHPFIKKCSGIKDFFAKLIQLEYLGDTSTCEDKPTERQMRELRCNVLANRRRTKHYQSRIDFIETAMEEGELQPVFPLYEDELKNNEISMMDIFCIKCGYVTELSGASCRKCNNCGESEGCG